MNTAVWEQLKAELNRVLAARGASKTASAAPGDAFSKVQDLAVSNDAEPVFTFSYRNTGDYDQNGTVGIEDLAQVGIHYGKTTASPSWQTAQVADGTFDGTIGIADVAPIGIHWGTKVEGYELQRSPTPEPAATWTADTEIALTTATLPSGGGFKQFSYTETGPPIPTGNYYRVVPFTGTGVARSYGIGSNVVQYTAGGLPTPQNLYATDGDYIDKIVLSWDTSTGATGYLVYRDSQGSAIATLGAVNTYEDTGAGDTSMHTYWVAATDGANQSDYSLSNEGYVGSAFSSTYTVLGWNDLGMHCMNQDFSKLMILPPYNTLHAQIIRRSSAEPEIITDGVTVEYSIPGNTTSVAKTNFWDYVDDLLGVSLAADQGLTGNGLSGQMVSLLAEGRNDWNVTGIPVTPLNDAMQLNAYPLSRISVLEGMALVAETQAVVPVSWEISCSLCHASEDAILASHDAYHGTALAGNTPVLCGNCHAQPALNLPGDITLPTLSSAMHSAHSPRMGSVSLDAVCYACHPGQVTQCLRDVHFADGMLCTDCHGGMDAVGDPARAPWVDEPRCDDCHDETGFEFEQPGTLYRNSIGHNGIHCAACHGSPHAIQETVIPADNVQALALQGHSGKIDTCSLCHSEPPEDDFNHTAGEGGD